MAITIVPFAPEHTEAVKAFNRRISSAPAGFRIDESPADHPFAREDGSGLNRKHYLALDDGIVHGGYIIKHQQFFCRGQREDICDFQLPISEVIVDSHYGMIGLQLASNAVHRFPLLFSLGMGGMNLPLPRLQRAMHWRMVKCPFYFMVNRPFTFLRGMAYLRKQPLQRLVLDALAFSGIGWAGLKVMHWLKGLRSPRTSSKVAIVDQFGDWADEIWDGAKDIYTLVAVRDQVVLNKLYPQADNRFLRLKVEQDGHVIGWAVMLDSIMSGHKQFGNLRVGTVVDCFSLPGMEATVINMATQQLKNSGVDLIVSNQLHRIWGAAFKATGYLSGPSNFVFAASPKLTEKLSPFDSQVHNIHMNRGDGDGPIHL
jgi:hypothetical protein